MADCNIFNEDEVCHIKKDKSVAYGLVLENAEYVSSDEEESGDDDRLKKGTVYVAWHPDGKTSVISEKQVHLADRSLMPGDVVRRSDRTKGSVQGFVEDVHVMCHLQIIGTNKWIYNIDSKDLGPLQDFDPDPGDVTLDSWVGKIEVIDEHVIVRFADGARCLIENTDVLYKLTDLTEKRDQDDEFYNDKIFPNQEWRGSLGKLEDVKWLQTTKAHNAAKCKRHYHMQVTVIVEEVKTESVSVTWTSCGFKDTDLNAEQPPSIIKGDYLKRLQSLDCFDYCSVQIGDQMFYNIKSTDVLETVSPQKQKQMLLSAVEALANTNGYVDVPGLHHDGSEAASMMTNDENEMEATMEDDQDEEYEDIEEDNSDSASVHSSNSNRSAKNKKYKSSKSAMHLTVRKLRRGKTKIKKAIPRQKSMLAAQSFSTGERVAVEICYTFSVVQVMWQDATVEKDIPSTDLVPIHTLDEHEFFPGDYICSSKDSGTSTDYGVIVSCNHSSRTCIVKWMKAFEDSSEHQMPIEVSDPVEVSVYDIKDHPDYRYRPGHCVIRISGDKNADGPLQSVGQVHALSPEGRIHVRWVNGSVSDVYPQQLVLIGGDNYSDLDSDTYSIGSDDSWETETEEDVENEEDERHSSSGDATGTDNTAGIAMQDFLRQALTNSDFPVVDQINYQQTLVLEILNKLNRLQGNGDADIRAETFRRLIEIFYKASGRSIVPSEDILAITLSSLDKILANAPLDGPDNRENGPDSLSSLDQILDAVSSDGPDHRENGPDFRALDCHKLKEELIGYIVEYGRRHHKLKDDLINIVLELVKKNVQPLEKKSKKTSEESTSEGAVSSAASALETDVPVSVTMSDGNDDRLAAERDEAQSISNKNEAAGSRNEPADSVSTLDQIQVFHMMENVPSCHKFERHKHSPNDRKQFAPTIHKEMMILRTSLPEGIIVKGFEDRLDLFSVLIFGPVRTPYEDGLFCFDLQLPSDYPVSPPVFHYHSYCSDRLNPNLYEDGKVCISLLGTWSGKGNELWTSKSNILQVLVSIQGLILVGEPYYNEAGYERQRGSQLGLENSRLYNEMAILKLVQSMTNMASNPPKIFEEEVRDHLKKYNSRFIRRLRQWMQISEEYLSSSHMESRDNASMDDITPSSSNECQNEREIVAAPSSGEMQTDFPLLPASRGFCLTLKTALEQFESAMRTLSSQPRSLTTE